MIYFVLLSEIRLIIIYKQILTEDEITVDGFSINKIIFEYDVIVMYLQSIMYVRKKSHDIEVHVTLNYFV